MKKFFAVLLFFVFCFPFLGDVFMCDIDAQILSNAHRQTQTKVAKKTTPTRQSTITKNTVKDEFKKILSSSKDACEKIKISPQSRTSALTKKAIKKITTCPVNIYNTKNEKISMTGMVENLAIKYSSIQYLIYFLSFCMLVFIWARGYWAKRMEWTKFYYTTITIAVSTVIGLIIDWYIIKDNTRQQYIVDCKRPTTIMQICSQRNRPSITINQNMIIIDKDGNILDRDDLSNQNAVQKNVDRNMFL
jgi:hypothetical protein